MKHEAPYAVEFHCDVCNKRRSGVEYPVAGFHIVCDYCTNPPVVVAAWRRAKWVVAFYSRKAKYYATTTAAERAARRAHTASVRARINARRAAEGRPLIGEALARLNGDKS
jgi:hypothetical protein